MQTEWKPADKRMKRSSKVPRSWSVGQTLGFAALGGAAGWLALRHARRIELRGAVAVVTGGGRGLGHAIARELANEGCRLALCGRDGDVIASAVSALQARGVEAMGAACDTSDAEAVEHFIDDVVDHYGRIDVLINNAGQCFVGPAAELETPDMENALRNIFWSQYLPTMAALPHMRRRRAGRIVNVTSIGGKVPTPHQSAYVAAKFAATGWSQTLAVELRKDGLEVSTVTPPPLDDGAPLHAHFNGHAEAELLWFARTLTSRVRATSTERAARAVVSAARHGDTERTVSFSSWLASRAYGSAPGLMSRLMSVVDRGLPPTAAPGVTTAMSLGADVVAASSDPRLHALAADSRRDARRISPWAG